jgi:hypothetical protein
MAAEAETDGDVKDGGNPGGNMWCHQRWRLRRKEVVMLKIAAILAETRGVVKDGDWKQVVELKMAAEAETCGGDQ